MRILQSTKFYVTNSSSDIYVPVVSNIYDVAAIMEAIKALVIIANDDNLVKELLKGLSNVLVYEEAIETFEYTLCREDLEELQYFAQTCKISNWLVETFKQKLLTDGTRLMTYYPQDGDGCTSFENALLTTTLEGLFDYYRFRAMNVGGYSELRLDDVPFNFLYPVFAKAKTLANNYRFLGLMTDETTTYKLAPKTDKDFYTQIQTDKELEAFYNELVEHLKTSIEDDLAIGLYADKDNLFCFTTDYNELADKVAMVKDDASNQFKLLTQLVKLYSA